MIAFAFVVFCTACISWTSSSAIPMWELLSKEEKMSYLYSMFAYQVEEFCEFSEMRNCNQELLKHGLTKLKSLSEGRLDAMDPYQRGASSIVWNTIMQGHVKQTKTTTTTTTKPNSYEDELSVGDDELGSQGLESAKIENVYRFFPSGYVSGYHMKSGVPEYKQQRLENEIDYRAPLTGPMVVRVHLDGTPVDDRIPQDEDLKHYRMSQIKLPTF